MCPLLPFSLDSPVPSSHGQTGSSPAGSVGKETGVGQVPRALRETTGSPHYCSTSYLLGGTSVKYQHKSRLGDVSKENKLYKTKREQTER